jgi:hypothetical protein
MVRKYYFLLLCLLVLSSGSSSPAPNSPQSGIYDPCSSYTHFLRPGSRCLIICPKGDGPSLAYGGNEIEVVSRDGYGQPIPGILASDHWLYGGSSLSLCGGSGSIDADADGDVNGQAVISGILSAGGCCDEIMVVCLAVVIGCPPTRLAISVRSPDLDADLLIDLRDFALFSPNFPSPSNPYDSCCDYDCNGIINLVDFSMFAQHWQHGC